MVLLNFISNQPYFFFKMAAIEKMLTLSDFNENWYHVVIWFEEHDGTIKAMFWAASFPQAVHIMPYCYALLDRWAIQALRSL